MKSWKIIFTTLLSALVWFAVCGPVRSATDTPDPGSVSVSNTADGQLALAGLTSGIYNSAFGFYSLLSNSDASFNTGVGAGALLVTNASQNTAVGAGALLSNTTGSPNTAVGTFAMFSNVDGSSNVAVGDETLEFNVSAVTNVAVGQFALQNNDSSGTGSADFNTAVGGFTMPDNVDGTRNTAVGAGALEGLNGGSDNTAIGELAGSNLATGNGNVYVGSGVSAGASGEVRFIRIGDTGFTDYDCFIAGIAGRNVDSASALFVFVDGNQKLGTNLVDANGNSVPFKPQAMLDESLKQQKRIAELEGLVTHLAATVKEQSAQIQRVSAQLEVNKPAARVVANKR